MKISANSLLLVLAFTLSPVVSAETAPTLSNSSQGATSKAEGDSLFSNAEQDLKAGRISECIRKLERLKARYPGAPGYLRADLLLGQCEEKQSRYKEAALHYKDYVDALKHRPESIDAQILMAKSLIKARDFEKALNATQEIENNAGFEKLRTEDPNLAALVFLIQARCEIEKGRATAAEDARSKARLLPFKDPELKAEESLLAVEQTLLNCKTFPSKEPLLEEQFLEQIHHKSLCFQEALTGLWKLASHKRRPLTQQGAEHTRLELQEFRKACRESHEPPPLEPKDRTDSEKKAYFVELGTKLKTDCMKYEVEFKTLTASWKKDLSPETRPLIEPLLLDLSKGNGRASH